MKKILIQFLFIFGLLGALNAQTQKISYLYDAAGNRSDRIIDYDSQQSPQHAKQAQPAQYEDKLFGDKQVIIYPNPTEGQVTVEIQNYDAATTGSISISTVNGRLLQQAEIIAAQTPLDISAQPDGMYLFVIRIDGQVSTWKILKK